MATWHDLEKELNRWHAAGEQASLWWRDDDAGALDPQLEHLLALAARYHVPLHLAVVPLAAQPELVRRLAASGENYVLQHGYAHVNHEPIGGGASEIGVSRSVPLQLADLKAGRERLRALEFANLLPVLAPPWNRIGAATVRHLPGLGFRLLSTSLPRAAVEPVSGLLQVNIHADPIRWRGGARFRGTAKTLACIVEHLQQRRLGDADKAEPTGLSTHHLQTMEEAWGFVEELLDRLVAHPATHWARLAQLMNHRQTA